MSVPDNWIKLEHFKLGPCPNCKTHNKSFAYQTGYYIYVSCDVCDLLYGPIIDSSRVIDEWDTLDPSGDTLNSMESDEPGFI